ncbi:MAG: hypothetical protein ACK2T5_06515 [Anaerolineales bacterium]|jgi:hypothetical protein
MLNTNFAAFSKRLRVQRGLLFGLLIVGALLAFELFNYSTTDFALTDLLGDLRFLGIRWATILSLAFCGIDFAGIARLFTPEQGRDEPAEVWYLFGAWMLAATMNAMLTWWGVSIALLNHQSLGTAVVERTTLIKIVPIFVAMMVWLTRVLIIGTLSVAGDRIFSQVDLRRSISRNTSKTYARPQSRTSSSASKPPRNLPRGVTQGVRTSPYRSYNPAPKPEPTYETDHTSQEPVYTPVSFSGNRDNNRQTRF